METTDRTYEQKDLDISITDLLAGMLLSWKTILFCMILFGATACGLVFLRGPSNKAINDEDIARSRLTLASDQASDVDQLFLQYKAYQDFQRQLKDYYAQFVANNLDLGSMVRLFAQYQITSNMENLDRILSVFTLTETDYDALRKIEPDEEFGAPIYRRVGFSTVTNARVILSNFDNETATPFTYLLIVTVYGKTESQCQEMLQVITNAVERESNALRSLDPKLSCTFLGSEYNYNTVDYVMELQKSNIDGMTIAETEMNNLTTKISKLSADQKKYYNMLIDQAEQEYQPEEHISWKKWTVIGAFLGVLLAVGIYFVQYLFDGTVKTPGEAETLFHTHTLQRFSLVGKKNLFGKWAAGLRGSEIADPTIKTAMLAADLQLLMDKEDHKKLYLICGMNDIHAVSMAKEVASFVAERCNTIQITLGNPVASVEELELLAAAEDAVVFTELRHSRQKTLNRWQEICNRYHIPVVGSVAVETCW